MFRPTPARAQLPPPSILCDSHQQGRGCSAHARALRCVHILGIAGVGEAQHPQPGQAEGDASNIGRLGRSGMQVPPAAALHALLPSMGGWHTRTASCLSPAPGLVACRLAEAQAREPLLKSVRVRWREAGHKVGQRAAVGGIPSVGRRHLGAAALEVGSYLVLAPVEGKAGQQMFTGLGRLRQVAAAAAAASLCKTHQLRASAGGSGTSRPSSSASSCNICGGRQERKTVRSRAVKAARALASRGGAIEERNKARNVVREAGAARVTHHDEVQPPLLVLGDGHGCRLCPVDAHC